MINQNNFDPTLGGKVTNLIPQRPQVKATTETTDETANESDKSQLSIARKVIADFGDGNLLNTQDRFFRYAEKQRWEQTDDQIIRKAIITALESTEPDKISGNKVDSVLRLTKTEAYIEGIEFDNPAGDTIALANGELTLINGEMQLGAHVRENYRTRHMPIAFDPTAKAPRFEKALNEMFLGDSDAEDKIKLLAEYMGYTLTKDTKYEKFMMLHGEGSNGKSVILFLLEHLLGAGNYCTIHPDRFFDRFQTASFFGAFANIVTELGVDDVLSDKGIKQVSSGESLQIEEKFKKSFSFRSRTKLWFATNHRPKVKDLSKAFWRRPMVLVFNRAFTNQGDPDRTESDGNKDPDLKVALLDELPGILNFALEGLKRLRANNKFTEPQSSKDALAAWRAEGNQVEQFVNDACVKNPMKQTLLATLYGFYKNWTEENGLKQLGLNDFKQGLTGLGIKEGRNSSGMTRIGIEVGPHSSRY